MPCVVDLDRLGVLAADVEHGARAGEHVRARRDRGRGSRSGSAPWGRAAAPARSRCRRCASCSSVARSSTASDRGVAARRTARPMRRGRWSAWSLEVPTARRSRSRPRGWTCRRGRPGASKRHPAGSREPPRPSSQVAAAAARSRKKSLLRLAPSAKSSRASPRMVATMASSAPRARRRDRTAAPAMRARACVLEALELAQVLLARGSAARSRASSRSASAAAIAGARELARRAARSGRR